MIAAHLYLRASAKTKKRMERGGGREHPGSFPREKEKTSLEQRIDDHRNGRGERNEREKTSVGGGKICLVELGSNNPNG